MAFQAFLHINEGLGGWGLHVCILREHFVTSDISRGLDIADKTGFVIKWMQICVRFKWCVNIMTDLQLNIIMELN